PTKSGARSPCLTMAALIARRGPRGKRNAPLRRRQELPDAPREAFGIDAVEPVPLPLPDLQRRRRDRPPEPVAILGAGLVSEERQVRAADLPEERLEEPRHVAVVLPEQRRPEGHHEALAALVPIATELRVDRG